jgi:hypothetical protein
VIRINLAIVTLALFDPETTRDRKLLEFSETHPKKQILHLNETAERSNGEGHLTDPLPRYIKRWQPVDRDGAASASPILLAVSDWTLNMRCIESNRCFAAGYIIPPSLVWCVQACI